MVDSSMANSKRQVSSGANLPTASLSIDLDNQWAYLRAAGKEDWAHAPSYFDFVIDRIVSVIRSHQLPLTVFVVGRDCLNEDDAHHIASLKRIQDVEFANHSLDHLPWMHTLSDSEVEHQITQAHQLIEDCGGESPIGFRGPGFSCPPEVIRILERLNYRYDASSFPTSMAPIARAVFLARTNLKGKELERAKKLYGGFASMRKPNQPHEMQGSPLVEVPVTTMPLLRTPIHFSYLMFLASFSELAAKAYFQMTLKMCKFTGTSPSLLLHPPDFMGADDSHDLGHMPGMKMTASKKLAFMHWALKLYSRHFDVQTIGSWVEDHFRKHVDASEKVSPGQGRPAFHEPEPATISS